MLRPGAGGVEQSYGRKLNHNVYLLYIARMMAVSCLGQIRRFDARFEPRPRESKTLVIAPSFCLAVLVSPF